MILRRCLFGALEADLAARTPHKRGIQIRLHAKRFRALDVLPGGRLDVAQLQGPVGQSLANSIGRLVETVIMITKSVGRQGHRFIQDVRNIADPALKPEIPTK